MPATQAPDFAAIGGKLGPLAKFITMLPEIKEGLKTLGNVMTKSWRDIQQSAFEAGRAMGMSRQQAMAYDRVLMEQTKDLGRQYGITYKDIAKFQEEFVNRTGRAIVMNRKAAESLAQLNRLAGSATASQLVDEMDKFGVSVNDATFQVATIQERARQMGLSTQMASDTLAKNIHLASTYQFKNGIDSLQKMVLKSQALRVNMESVVRASEGFQNIEGAITKSANLQMLGGSFGAQFSNPMAVMYEALNDQNAFFDRITKTVEGKAVFDKRTGEARITAIDQQFIKAAADALGMDRQELTQMAMRGAQGKAVAKEMRTDQNFTEVQEAFLKSQARWDAQQQKFMIDRKDTNGNVIESVAVSDVDQKMLKSLQDSEFTEKNLFGDVRSIRETVEEAFGKRAMGTTTTNENLEGLASEWDAFVGQLQNLWMGTIGSWAMQGPTFQPWDLIKPLMSGFGRFAEGGLVDSSNLQAKQPIKAQFGVAIPGNSTYGDKVPVMANSGEMILNKQEQSGLFDLIKKAGVTLGTAWLGNKVGKRFGMGNIGTMAAIGNVMSGGRMGFGGMLGSMGAMGVGSKVIQKMYGKGGMMGGMMPSIGLRSPMLGSPMMRGAQVTMLHPNVIMNGNVDLGGGDFVESVAEMTMSTRTLSQRLLDVGRNKNFVGGAARKLLKGGRATGEFFSSKKAAMMATPIMTAMTKWSDGFTAKLKDNFGSLSKLFDKDNKAVEGKKEEISDLISDVSENIEDISDNFSESSEKSNRKKNKSKGNGRKAKKKSKARQRFGRKSRRGSLRGGKHSMLSKSIGVSPKAIGGAVPKVADVATNSAKGASKSVGAVGKAMKGVANSGKSLLKLGKGLGRVAGPLATVLAVADGVSDIAGANSQFDQRVSEINNSGASVLDKARMKDEAEKERNKSIGGGVGKGVGGAIGATLGAALGPLGVIAGGYLGSLAGDFIGSGIGGLFGGGNEAKVLKQEEERAKFAKGAYSDDIVKNVRQIPSLLSDINNTGVSILDKIRMETEVKRSGNKSIGDGVDSVVNTTSRMALAPFGIAAKGIIGGLSDNFITKGISGLFGSGNDVNVLKPEEEKAKFVREVYNNDIVKNIKQAPTPLSEIRSNLISVPSIGSRMFVEPHVAPVSAQKPEVESPRPQKLDLNVTGTIKLDAGGQTANIDVDKLLKNPQFVDALCDIISKRGGELNHGGKAVKSMK